MNMQPPVTHHFATLGNLRLHYAEAGSGPLVILLHGFPDFWYSWRNQIEPLAAAGFRVVAPDMRGYNLSDKPVGIEAYTADRIADDVARLIQALGAEKASIVGHDWGGVVGWQLAMQQTKCVEKLVILNVPHPVRFLRGIRDPRQLARSWYVFFFQIPWLPERMFRALNFRSLKKALRNDTTRPDAFTEEDLDRYAEAWSQPGAMTSSINYYRAALRYGRETVRSHAKRIDLPVLILWGDRDRYVRPQLAEPDSQWVTNFTLHRFPHASHWVHMDVPQRVNQLLIEFLRS